MKKILFFQIVAFFFVCLSEQVTIAQQEPALSLFYNYSIMYQQGAKIDYPLGIGASFFKPVAKRFTLRTGAAYSFRQSIDNSVWKDYYTNLPHIVLTKMNESSYSINLGLYYNLIKVGNNLSIKLGANITPNYSHFTLQSNRYYDTVEEQYNHKVDLLSLGINTGIMVDYSVSKRFSILIEPGYTNYLLGDYKSQHALNVSGGIIFRL